MTSEVSADFFDMLVKNTVAIFSESKNNNQNKTTPNYGRFPIQSQTLQRQNIIYTQPNSKSSFVTVPTINANKSAKVVCSGPLISRSVFFPNDCVRMMRLSPNGSKIAYVAKNNGGDALFSVTTDGSNRVLNVANERIGIDDVSFAGDNVIVYTYRDQNNCGKLKMINLSARSSAVIPLIANAKSIKIIQGRLTDDIAAICYSGKKYYTYKIDAKTFQFRKIKEDYIPLNMLFDDNLTPILYYKNFSGSGVDVFVRTTGMIGEEKLVDHIMDVKKEKYVSADRNFCYKISQINNNDVQVTAINLQTGARNVSYISGVPLISDCCINVDAEGSPLFSTVNLNHRKNASLRNLVNGHIGLINNRFSDFNWHRVGATSDGNIWLLRVCKDTKSDCYWLYDLRSKRFIEIAVSNRNVDNLRMLQTKCVQIPVGTNGHTVRGYITQPQDMSRNTPLIIFAESDKEHRFNWEFNPMAQMLANRGYAVLSVNCCHHEPYIDSLNQNIIQSNTSAILAVADWCVRSGIAARGNISLVGKRSVGVFCANAFAGNQAIFSSCLLISVDFPNGFDLLSKINVLRTLSKPIMVINSATNSAKYRNLLRNANMKGAKLSYITYGARPLDVNAAGLVEKFLSLVHNAPRENISPQSIAEFAILFDGCNVIRAN
jgi:hypothetical protein